jgi:hypothetical protein
MNLTNTATEAWFDEFVATLRTHELQLQTDTANPQLRKFYEGAFSGNTDQMAHFGKTIAQKHFVSLIIFDFLRSIKEVGTSKLAFDYNDSEVLVWAEVEDDDEKSERALLIAQAKINAKFHPYGFDMETTIVEKGDRLKTPNHYKVFKS